VLNLVNTFQLSTAPNLRNHDVYSFYQPGKLAFGLVDGKGYVVSADTGKTKTYTSRDHGYDFRDSVRARTALNGNLNFHRIITINVTWFKKSNDHQIKGNEFDSLLVR
jgi:hypothetical protein